MRTITGALLLLAAEQSFANAYLVGFPDQAIAKEVLIPAAVILGTLGFLFLGWGLFTDSRRPPTP